MTPPAIQRPADATRSPERALRPLFRCDEDGGLRSIRGPTDLQPGPHLAAANAALQAFVEHKAYPCVGAKAAISRRSYVLSIYPSLGDTGTAGETAADVQWFGEHADSIDDSYATFVAVFSEANVADDRAFEPMLWAYLQEVHRADAAFARWDAAVSPDPSDPSFRFSVGGHAYFVIGMHPNAAREARRFPFPAIVFNLHRQFEKLRADGQFEKMRSVIRAREADLAGGPNPVLADHGDRSEASQYAGVAHPPGWRPPFEPIDHGGCPHAPGRRESARSNSATQEEPSHVREAQDTASPDRRHDGPR